MQCGSDDSAEKSENELLTKLKNIGIAVVIVMLSLGQWDDSKDAVVSVYEEVISRFTNIIEYKRLDKLRIGLTEQYTQKILGPPQVIKASKLIEDLQFYYYDDNKFLLISFIKNKRLSGFTLISKNSDFLAPVAYIKKQLNSAPIGDYLPSQDTIHTNIGSLEFYSESYDLSRNLMFYKLLLGHVNYTQSNTEYSQTIIDVSNQLSLVEEFDFSAVVFPSPLIPNFYSITEYSAEVMLESLLSNYEMSALFND